MPLAPGDIWQFPEGWTHRFSRHAGVELIDRNLDPREAEMALRREGEVLEVYPPAGYKSWNYLLLCQGWNRQLHLVIALLECERCVIVVTVYEPDPLLWESGARVRRRK